MEPDRSKHDTSVPKWVVIRGTNERIKDYRAPIAELDVFNVPDEMSNMRLAMEQRLGLDSKDAEGFSTQADHPRRKR